MKNEISTQTAAAITAARSIDATLAAQFIDFCDASPKTIATYRTAIRHFLAYLHDNAISRPTRADLLAYKADLLTNCSAGTVSLYMTAVRLFFRYLAEQDLYKNIADNIKGAKISRDHKRDAMTGAQVKAVMQTTDDTITGLRDYAIISLMATCGLRRIEVARANIGHLRAVGNDTMLFVQGKGKDDAGEAVVVMPQVEKAIRRYLAARADNDDAAPMFVSHSNNSSNGKRIDVRSISEIVKRHMRQAGYNSSRLTAHSLRHTAVTLALLNGKTLQQTQSFARHANIATTMIYAHNLEATTARRECSTAVAASIFN